MVLLQLLKLGEELPLVGDHGRTEPPQQLEDVEEGAGEGQPLTEGHSAAETVAEELAPEPRSVQHLAEVGLAVPLARVEAAGRVQDQALNLRRKLDARDGDQWED